MKVVDVGCGTGDFTRYLASLIPGKCTVIGVDISAANIKTAEKQTKEEGLASKIRFRKGDAYNIPVEPGWADLVCCRCLLMHLTDPVKAVHEMRRVARRNGTVAAFERGRFLSIYIPDNEKLTKLGIRMGESYFDGVRKLEGKNFDIGNRLPTIFYKAGLREIKADVEAHPFLATDPRRDLRDTKNELEFHLATFRNGKKNYAEAMTAGGASKAEIRRYILLIERWMKGLLNDNQKIGRDTFFTTGGIGRVNTGGLILVAGRNVVEGSS